MSDAVRFHTVLFFFFLFPCILFHALAGYAICFMFVFACLGLCRLSYLFSALSRKMYIHCMCAQARFASFQLDWATTTGRLLGPTTCLPHENGGIPLSTLPKDITSKLAGLFFSLSLIVLNAMQGSCKHRF